MMGAIRIVTPVPGPRSRAVMERAARAVPRGIAPQAPVVAAEASGALITDLDGNTFIDLSGGIGVLNTGHRPPEVAQAVHAQVDRFLHTDYSVVPYEPYVALAERLSRLAPIPGARKACFFNSGAEAVENACKFARLYTRRPALIAYEGGFHGRTLLALSLTSKPRPYKKGMGPFAPEVYRVPYAYCYRCPLGLEHPGCGVECARALERAFATLVSSRDTAAVVVEPVQGEGGFVVPPPEFLPMVRDICRRHGVLLILDEIQTGFYRTGRLFACEHTGVQPDLICVAKSLAAGLPLSGVVGRAEVLDAAEPGNIGGTYVGNPVACAAALAVLDLLEGRRGAAETGGVGGRGEGGAGPAGDADGRGGGFPPGPGERAEAIGRYLVGRFRAMEERYGIIGDVRGLGAMVGVELVRDRETKEPATQETEFILQEALRRGVIVPRCGLYGNVLRFLNPLTIGEAELAEAVDVLEEVIADADAALARAGAGAATT